MIGTLVNVVAVIIGSSIGLLIRNKLPDRFIDVTFQILGLFTIVLGTKMALGSQNLLVLIFSLLIGSLLGSALKLNDLLEKQTERLNKRFDGTNKSFNDMHIVEISAVGGVLLLALGLNLIKITQFKIIDFLPSLLFTPLLLFIYAYAEGLIMG
jgi:uncharacterized membrane protein YqgA involved in biofilm formation